MTRRLIPGVKGAFYYISKWSERGFGFFSGSNVAEPDLRGQPEVTAMLDEANLVDHSDPGLDCSEKVHRRFCRKFDREVRQLYWLPPEEVTEGGNYLRFEGGFHVPQNIVVLVRDGQAVTLDLTQTERSIQPIDPRSIYLGPLPTVPPSLDIEW